MSDMTEKPDRTDEKTTTALVLLSLSHAAVLGAVIFLAATGGAAFQVEIFRDYADRIAAGELPYADFPHEYPPLSLAILILPRLFTADPTLYAALFGVEILICDLVIMFVLSRIGLKPLVLYGVSMLLFWRVPYIRHDLVPVAVSTLGAFALLRGRFVWAAVLWGIGGALKLYPAVCVPVLAFGATLRETIKRWTLAGAVFVAGVAWGIFAFGSEALMFLTYHSERPAQVESLAGNIQFFVPDFEVVNTFGSFNVVGPGSEALVSFFSVFQIAMTLLGLGAAYVHGRRHGTDMRVAAVRGAALATFAFSVFGKVFAWHYLFWPLPLVAMAYGLVGFRFPKLTWGLYFAAIILTTAINEQYWAVTENIPYFVVMLTARNLILLPLFVLLLLPPKDSREQS
jgi:hypothetical protein